MPKVGSSSGRNKLAKYVATLAGAPQRKIINKSGDSGFQECAKVKQQAAKRLALPEHLTPGGAMTEVYRTALMIQLVDEWAGEAPAVKQMFEKQAEDRRQERVDRARQAELARSNHAAGAKATFGVDSRSAWCDGVHSYSCLEACSGQLSLYLPPSLQADFTRILCEFTN